MADTQPQQLAAPIALGSIPKPSPGLLGEFLHLLGQTGTDLKDAAINSPAGIYHLAGGLIHHPVSTVEQVGQSYLHDFEHPLRHPGFTALDILSLAGGAGAVAGRVGATGAVLSRAGGLSPELEAATRGALANGDLAGATAAARALGKEGEFTKVIGENGVQKPLGRQVRSAVIRGAAPEERLLPLYDSEGKVVNHVHGWWYSKNASIRAAQKLVDKSRAAFPNSTPPAIWRVLPPFWRSQGGRLKSATKATNLQEGNINGSQGKALWKKFKDVPDSAHLAVRMVLEGTTPKEFRDYHQNLINSDELTGREIRETNKRLEMLPEAEKLLEVHPFTFEGEHPLKGQTFGDVPVLRPDAGDDLHEYLGKARELANEREGLAQSFGLLTDDSRVARIVGPLHEMKYGRVPVYGEGLLRMKQALEGKKRFQGEDSAEVKKLADEYKSLSESPPLPKEAAQELIDRAGLARVPYEIPNRIKAFGGGAYRKAYKGTSEPGAPSTFTHPFQAGILRRGGGDTNTAKLLAQTYTEAHRFLSLRGNWMRIQASLRPTPEGIPKQYRVLVKREGGNPLNITREQATRGSIKDPESLSPEEASAGGMLYEGIRGQLFKGGKEATDFARTLLGHDQEEYAPVQGYGWADSRLLGGLDKANPLAAVWSNTSPIVSGAVKSMDFLNTIQKSAILYLKPAYIAPNVFGNVFMNLIQQGFLAPVNLTRAVFNYWRLDKDTLSGIQSALGEGSSLSLLKGQGNVLARTQHLANKVAGGYGHIVDDVFRMASFLHEAASAGFTTPEEIARLVKDPAHRPQFVDLASRANDEIINYERMGPGEQAVLRRLVFFYPWLKGSSRYTLQALSQHPTVAGLTGQEGKTGAQQQELQLGKVPAFAESIFKVGGSADNPLVVNPSSAAVFSTPGELGSQLANIFHSPPNADLNAIQNLSPVDRMLLTILTSGKASLGPGAAKNPVYETAFNDYSGGNPLQMLIQNLTSTKPPNALYPEEGKTVDWSRFLALGGLTPRPYNRAKGENIAYKEKHPH